MTILDVCQCFKLTSFNSQKDLMGLIVKLRSWVEAVGVRLVLGWGLGSVIVLAGGDSLWKGWLHNPDM